MASEKMLFKDLRLTPEKLTRLWRQMLFSEKTSTWLCSSARLPSFSSSNIHVTDSQMRGPRLTTKWEGHDSWCCVVREGTHPTLVRNGSCSLSPGRELVTGHWRGPLEFPTTPGKFRKCFQAGSDTHTRWDTPPGSETTPSCGWCVPHARRSGRNWTILELPRGRWHTGMWSLCRWCTVCHGPRFGSGCSTRQTLQMVGDGQNKRHEFSSAKANWALWTKTDIFILGLCRTPIRPVIFDFLVWNSRTPSSTISSVIKRSCCHCSGRVRAEGTAGAWLSYALVKPRGLPQWQLGLIPLPTPTVAGAGHMESDKQTRVPRTEGLSKHLGQELIGLTISSVPADDPAAQDGPGQDTTVPPTTGEAARTVLLWLVPSLLEETLRANPTIRSSQAASVTSLSAAGPGSLSFSPCSSPAALEILPPPCLAFRCATLGTNLPCALKNEQGQEGGHLPHYCLQAVTFLLEAMPPGFTSLSSFPRLSSTDSLDTHTVHWRLLFLVLNLPSTAIPGMILGTFKNLRH